MQSLHLSPDADTPSVAIAGTVLLTYAAIIGHIILLLAFLIIAFLKEKEITVGQAGLLLNFKKAKSVNIIATTGISANGVLVLELYRNNTSEILLKSIAFHHIANSCNVDIHVWIINLVRTTEENISTNAQQRLSNSSYIVSTLLAC